MSASATGHHRGGAWPHGPAFSLRVLPPAVDAASDDQRDHEEEAYLARFCPACGGSPCTWDGQPDGFHTDDDPFYIGGQTIAQERLAERSED